MYTTENIKWQTIKYAACLSILWISLSQCADDENAPVVDKEPEPLAISIPSNFPEPVYDLNNNPVTKEGVALGKKIFYDVRLSRTHTISCGFCHMQSFAFTHHGHDLSHGVDDQLGRRNSLPIQNLAFYKTFFWDGGVHNLDLIALNAIGNKAELDEEPENILSKLRADNDYPQMFDDAFGTNEITSTRFLQALSQFLATMVSANSRYDLHIRGEAQLLSQDELDGLELFRQNCASCHATDLFTDQSYRNNGFSSETDLIHDQGRAEITLNSEDIGKFKVPSLRNVEYTAPYMHNGKLPTLESVMNFYTDHVQLSPSLDPLLNQLDAPGLKLTADEKKKIIAFLKTLTDETYLHDSRFAPF